MDRQKFFSLQVPGPAELEQLEDDIESSISGAVTDFGPSGFSILSGLLPSQQGSPDMTVSVSAGVAYDNGAPRRRVHMAAPAMVNMALDQAQASTIPAATKFAWVTLVAVFSRIVSNHLTVDDGTETGATTEIDYRQVEGLSLRVYKGADAASSGAAAYPTLPAGAVILADYMFSSATASVTDAMRDVSRRTPGFSNERAPGAGIDQIGAATFDSCLVVPDSPYSMKVRVRAGRVNSGTQSFPISSALTASLTAPSANPKYALVYIDNGGAIAIAYGAENASPVKPTTEQGVPLAYVLLSVGQTQVKETHLTDARPFLGGSGSLNRSYCRLVATGGETLLAIGFTYVPGTNALEVYDNGTKIDGNSVTETDSTHITLSARTAGHVVEVYGYAPSTLSVPGQHAATHGKDGGDPIDFSSLDGCVVGDTLISANPTVQSGYATAVNVERVAAIIGGRMVRNVSSFAVTLPGLAASTRYYVYGYVNPAVGAAQQVLFECNTTVPDAANRYKTGDSSRVFLCSLISDAGSHLYPFVKRNGEVRLVGDETNAPDFANGAGAYGLPRNSPAVASGGLSGDVLTFSNIPPTAREALASIYYIGTSNELTIYGYASNGTMYGMCAVVEQAPAGPVPRYANVRLPLNGAQQFRIKGDASSFRGILIGWKE
jgi:hypothetical protein